MSKDMMIFNICDHNIDNIQYEDDSCPLCHGTGIYYDFALDEKGKIVTCENEIKLQQEIMRILNDKKGGNKFDSNYGNAVYERIGNKRNNVVKQKIQIIIYETLQYLRNLQLNDKIIFNNMTEEELLDEISSVDVAYSNSKSYVVSVTFKNAKGKTFSQNIIF